MTVNFKALLPRPVFPFSEERYMQLSKELRKYEELEIQIKQLTGLNIECLKKLFAMGYTLKYPDYDMTLTEMAEPIDREEGGGTT